jgi:hypothetical protein
LSRTTADRGGEKDELCDPGWSEYTYACAAAVAVEVVAASIGEGSQTSGKKLAAQPRGFVSVG